MRVLVCGGRDFVDVPVLWRRLDQLHATNGITTIIEGASDDVTGPYVGADFWAHQWGLSRGIETIRVHAKWTVLGRAAGPLRNKEMAQEQRPDVVIAFPGGNGTASMLREAIAAGIPHELVGFNATSAMLALGRSDAAALTAARTY